MRHKNTNSYKRNSVTQSTAFSHCDPLSFLTILDPQDPIATSELMGSPLPQTLAAGLGHAVHEANSPLPSVSEHTSYGT